MEVMSDLALVLDIGGSHVTSALVDLEQRATIRSSIRRLPLDPNANADELLKIWVRAAQKALNSDAAHTPSPTHMGIAMPGPFDYETGISRLQHKFASLYGMNIRTELQGRLNTTIPIYFGNDASLFALGEWWAGAAREHQRVIGVTLGTGLGGGFVAMGRVYYSGQGVPQDGGIWNLPYLDTIAEDYVSGPSLVKNYTHKTGRILEPLEIAQVARNNDGFAQEVYLELGTHLGNILEPWVQSFGASCVVVGGNIARSWDLFAMGLENTLGKHKVKRVASSLFDEANLLGAAALGK
jgi:glucokinase